MKTSCFKRTLSILLCVLLATPTFMLSTFAEGETFTALANYSTSCEPGEQWIDRYDLATATGTDAYKTASFYLSEDGNTIKIEYTANDETVTELHDRATDAEYFDYLHTLPAFGDPLPTSEEGLADGDYWFDLDGFIALFESTGNMTDEMRAMYSAATFRLSVDGTILRMTFSPVAGINAYQDEFVDDPEIMCGYLRQVGVDPNEGFTLLPTSEEGLPDGAYWFDLAGFLSSISQEQQQIFSAAQYYISDDGVTMRIVIGTVLDFTKAQEPAIFSYLHQVGVDPNEGFTLLPTSEEGLPDGAYWYDAAGLAAMVEIDALATAQYYLSDDGNTIRLISSVIENDFARTDDEGPMIFGFLRQVGVDPNAGFTRLPISEDDLPDGAYWYDAAGLAELAGDDSFLNYEYYISDDGNTLRAIVSGATMDFSRSDESAELYFRYLRVAGVDPNAGFTLLPTSADDLPNGAYWYDLAGFAAETGSESQTIKFYLSDDGNTLRIDEGGYVYNVKKSDAPAGTYFAYLRRVGEVYSVLPISEEGLADGTYWYDAAGLAAILEDDAYLTAEYALRDDGEMLRVITASETRYFMKDSQYYSYYFQFLRKAGVDPNAGFDQLPISPDGLTFGDYWFDAAGFAEGMVEEEELEEFYASVLYYLNKETRTLRIDYYGVIFNMSIDDEEAADTVMFLHEITTDPETGMTFTHLPKSPDGLADGEYWYDAAGIASATGEAYLQDAEAYLSADGNMIRVLIMGETLDFVKDDGEDSDLVYSFLRQVGDGPVDPNAGFTLLPTSADGLSDGDYWFDIVSFAAFSGGDEILNAQVYLKNNGSVLRMIVNGRTEDIPKEKDSARYYFNYLIQVGHDPIVDEGFTRLPTSDAGLADGEWWYDAAALSEAVSLPYENARFYLSTDGTTLRVIFGDQTDYTRDTEQGSAFLNYLRQVGVDPNEGFTLLPTSEEGLEDGAYWFDVEGLNMLTANAFTDSQFYLSDDGTTLRVVNRTTEDYLQSSDEGAILFVYLRTVGVDSNAGFIQLPTSSDGLNVGDLWFDAESLAESENDQDYLHYTYYISEDGATLRVSVFGYPNDMTADSEDGAFFFPYLKRVAGEPGTAYLTMTASAQTVRRGDTVTVTVDLAQNPGLAGMTLSLGYDADALTLTDVQAGGMFETGNLTVGGDFAVLPYNILWDDATSHDVHSETGTILTLTFTVNDTAAAGETTVTMTCDTEGTFDVELQNVPVIITGAALTIDTHFPGDVDGDGELDLADVVALTRFLAGGWDVTVDETNCDVNGDGSIDLKDVILIRRFLAGGWDVTLV